MSVILRKCSYSKVLLQRACQCLYTTGKDGGTKSTPAPKAAPAKPPTKATPKPAAAAPPFDNTKYSCGDYYSHDKWSFYNIETTMIGHRIGQPSKFQ